MTKDKSSEWELLDLVLSNRDYDGNYHHHKESMAYIGAVLYLTAAATLFAENSSDFSGCKSLVLVVLVLLGFAFVVWQLCQRCKAAIKVDHWNSMLLELSRSKASKEQYAKLKKHLKPEDKCLSKRKWIPVFITLVPMAIMTILVFWKLYCK